MKKRALSLLMALCLMLTLAPAAFAAEQETPEQIYFHGEWVDIPVIDPPLMALSDDETSNVIEVRTQKQFEDITPSQWLSGATIKLYCDINLAEMEQPDEWGGYITYFDANLIGVSDGDTKPVIYGFANNTALFYGMVHGTISNITLDFDGAAGQLGFMPCVYSASVPDSYYSITIDGVDTTGYVNLTEADQSNYSPFIYAANKGDLIMKDCVNAAAITGDIYGAIFHGYYALNTTGSYTFENCRNEGVVTMRNAAMFFGNPSTMNAKLESGLEVNIINCVNNGIISGTISQHYFVPSLNSADYSASDTALTAKEASLNITGTGSLISAQTNGLSGNVADDGTITFFYTGTGNPTEFIVSVSSYVNMWDPTRKIFDGTARYSVSESISPVEGNSYTATLKYLGVADSGFGNFGEDIGDYYTREADDGTVYYEIYKASDISGYEGYIPYASNTIVDGNPVNNSCHAPSFATVTAVRTNSDGSVTIIGFCTLK